jgi:hypothetical protein
MNYANCTKSSKFRPVWQIFLCHNLAMICERLTMSPLSQITPATYPRGVASTTQKGLPDAAGLFEKIGNQKHLRLMRGKR